MDNKNYTTERKKGQHLTDEERYFIQYALKQGMNKNQIAKALGVVYNTVKNEVQRGTVPLYNGKVERYKAEAGKKKYLENRQNCTPNYHCLEKARFLEYVVDKVKNEGWSLDACVGYALHSGEFSREEIVCTKTLYNYVDIGFLPIKNIDLPEKLHRKKKSTKKRENKRILGDSIEERPEEIDTREEFGHWEADSVIGSKKKGESCILTLVERQTRMAVWLKIDDHSAESVMKALSQTLKIYGEKACNVFKTVTTDNGSEFARLAELDGQGIKVYFAHPYSSWEKGTNECHNKMLRRFIPKGKSINDYHADDILFFADVINGLPRKILNYHTPEQLFERQLDKIYSS